AAMNNEMLAIKAQDSLERMKSEDDEEKRLRGEWLIKPKTDAEANSPPDFSYQARNTMASQRKSREMALTSALKKIEERYGSLFEEQERRIDECYQAKESAK
ncbi:MAG: hypothetical protein KGL35_10065, partial [Bradyrhizobium sp.]|nr:hypothetical protein [Bradyrhizobium sp.]